jgi:hypothetical protein
VTYKRLPPRRTDEEIRHLAEEWIAGRVVDADTVPANLVASVFMPILFGALADYSRQQLGRIFVFAIHGEDKTAGRSVNGYPMFAECRVWRRTDAIRAHDLCTRMRAALDAIQ